MMEKKLEDYLYLYLGCEVIVPDEKYPCKITMYHAADVIWVNDGDCDYAVRDVKPLLRPLSDMTEEEAKEYFAIHYKTYGNSDKEGIAMSAGHEAQYLLSKHFDLFGLIESGLAIDKTKLQNPK